jgi:hypothetical protein
VVQVCAALWKIAVDFDGPRRTIRKRSTIEWRARNEVVQLVDVFGMVFPSGWNRVPK